MGNSSGYETKYRAYYDAGARFVHEKGYGDDYESFLRECRQGGRLIECGCGEGSATALAADLGFQALGIDSAPSAIARAIEAHCGNHPGLEFLVGDVTLLDQIEAESFDVLADIGCLHMMVDHEDDMRRYLAHAFRILRLGGRAFFQNRVSPQEGKRWFPQMADWIDIWVKRIAGHSNRNTVSEVIAVGDRQVEIQVPVNLVHGFLDAADYVQLAAQAGFEIQHTHVRYPGVNSPFELVLVGVKRE